MKGIIVADQSSFSALKGFLVWEGVVFRSNGGWGGFVSFDK